MLKLHNRLTSGDQVKTVLIVKWDQKGEIMPRL